MKSWKFKEGKAGAGSLSYSADWFYAEQPLSNLCASWTPAFQLIIKIFYGILKGFNGLVSKGEFGCSNRTGCRRFVYTGLETLGGERMWGAVCDPAGVRPRDGLLMPCPSDLYWGVGIISTGSNGNERFRQEKRHPAPLMYV